MNISIDAEKAFDKIQHSYDKNSQKSGYKRNLNKNDKGYMQPSTELMSHSILKIQKFFL